MSFSRPQAPKRILEGHFTAAFGHSLALKDLAKKSNWVSFSLSIGKKKTPKKKERKSEFVIHPCMVAGKPKAIRSACTVQETLHKSVATPSLWILEKRPSCGQFGWPHQ